MTLVHKTSGYLSSYLLLLKIILQWIPLYTYHLAHVNSFCQQIFVYLSHARLCSCAEITKISKLDRAPAIKLLSAQCRSYTCLIVNQSSSKALDLNLGCTLELPGKTFKKKKYWSLGHPRFLTSKFSEGRSRDQDCLRGPQMMWMLSQAWQSCSKDSTSPFLMCIQMT